MDFYDVLAQVIALLLQRESRTSYRALKRQLALDDDYILPGMNTGASRRFW